MYKLTKAVSLPLKNEKKDFKPGNYDIPDLDLDHWFVQSLIKSGALSVISKSQDKRKVTQNPDKQVETIVIKGPEVPLSMQEKEDPVEIKPVKKNIPVEEEKSKDQNITVSPDEAKDKPVEENPDKTEEVEPEVKETQKIVETKPRRRNSKDN